MSLSIPEIEMRIKRQNMLLEERIAEYEVFGISPADVEKDVEIKHEIIELEKELKRLTEAEQSIK